MRVVIAHEVAHRQRGMILFQEAVQNQGKYFKLVPFPTVPSRGQSSPPPSTIIAQQQNP